MPFHTMKRLHPLSDDVTPPPAQVAAETTPEWTVEHQEQLDRQLRRLDVHTAVFDHDTDWSKA